MSEKLLDLIRSNTTASSGLVGRIDKDTATHQLKGVSLFPDNGSLIFHVAPCATHSPLASSSSTTAATGDRRDSNSGKRTVYTGGRRQSGGGSATASSVAVLCAISVENQLSQRVYFRFKTNRPARYTLTPAEGILRPRSITTVWATVDPIYAKFLLNGGFMGVLRGDDAVLMTLVRLQHRFCELYDALGSNAEKAAVVDALGKSLRNVRVASGKVATWQKWLCTFVVSQAAPPALPLAVGGSVNVSSTQNQSSVSMPGDARANGIVLKAPRVSFGQTEVALPIRGGTGGVASSSEDGLSAYASPAQLGTAKAGDGNRQRGGNPDVTIAVPERQTSFGDPRRSFGGQHVGETKVDRLKAKQAHSHLAPLCKQNTVESRSEGTASEHPDSGEGLSNPSNPDANARRRGKRGHKYYRTRQLRSRQSREKQWSDSSQATVSPIISRRETNANMPRRETVSGLSTAFADDERDEIEDGQVDYFDDDEADADTGAGMGSNAVESESSSTDVVATAGSIARGASDDNRHAHAAPLSSRVGGRPAPLSLGSISPAQGVNRTVGSSAALASSRTPVTPLNALFSPSVRAAAMNSGRRRNSAGHLSVRFRLKQSTGEDGVGDLHQSPLDSRHKRTTTASTCRSESHTPREADQSPIRDLRVDVSPRRQIVSERAHGKKGNSVTGEALHSTGSPIRRGRSALIDDDDVTDESPRTPQQHREITNNGASDGTAGSHDELPTRGAKRTPQAPAKINEDEIVIRHRAGTDPSLKRASSSVYARLRLDDRQISRPRTADPRAAAGARSRRWRRNIFEESSSSPTSPVDVSSKTEDGDGKSLSQDSEKVVQQLTKTFETGFVSSSSASGSPLVRRRRTSHQGTQPAATESGSSRSNERGTEQKLIARERRRHSDSPRRKAGKHNGLLADLVPASPSSENDLVAAAALKGIGDVDSGARGEVDSPLSDSDGIRYPNSLLQGSDPDLAASLFPTLAPSMLRSAVDNADDSSRTARRLSQENLGNDREKAFPKARGEDVVRAIPDSNNEANQPPDRRPLSIQVSQQSNHSPHTPLRHAVLRRRRYVLGIHAIRICLSTTASCSDFAAS
eukprot:INCI4060.1.p1 GENE.INCI4060.1~~INCI4060.1.p1  ORF type:complete len:1090 (-),score=163.52 INCI4060.1:911-4180(-)